MKIKSDFILRSAAGGFTAVSVGGEDSFNGVVMLNKTGAFLWECFQSDITRDEAVKKLTDKYDIDEKTAYDDVTKFIDKLSAAKIFE